MKKSKKSNRRADAPITKNDRTKRYAKRHPSFKKEKSWKHQLRFDRQKEPKDTLDRREKQEAKILRTNPIVEQIAPIGIPLKGVIRMRHLEGPLHLTHKQVQAILAELDSPDAAPQPEDRTLEISECLEIKYAVEGACSVCWKEEPEATGLKTALQTLKKGIERLEYEETLDEMPEDIEDLLEDEDQEPIEENPCIMDCTDPRDVQSGFYLHGTTIVIPCCKLGENTTLRKYVENVLESAYQDESQEMSDDNKE